MNKKTIHAMSKVYFRKKLGTNRRRRRGWEAPGNRCVFTWIKMDNF